MKYFAITVSIVLLLVGQVSAYAALDLTDNRDFSGVWVSKKESSALLIQNRNTFISVIQQNETSTTEALCKVKADTAHCSGNGVTMGGMTFLYKATLIFNAGPIIKEIWIIDYGGNNIIKGDTFYSKAKSYN